MTNARVRPSRRDAAAVGIVTLAVAAFCVNRVFTAGPDHLFFLWSTALCLLYAIAGPALDRPRRGRRSWLVGVCAGACLAAIFLLGAFAIDLIPWLADPVRAVTQQADRSPFWAIVLITVCTGVAEELFFRGGLYRRLPRRPVLWSTVAYTAVTAASGNAMLTLAAAGLGVVTGLQRRSSRGVLLPAATHVTWSLILLFAMPRILGS